MSKKFKTVQPGCIDLIDIQQLLRMSTGARLKLVMVALISNILEIHFCYRGVVYNSCIRNKRSKCPVEARALLWVPCQKPEMPMKLDIMPE
jgi:hypothetical protein